MAVQPKIQDDEDNLSPDYSLPKTQRSPYAIQSSPPRARKVRHAGELRQQGNGDRSRRAHTPLHGQGSRSSDLDNDNQKAAELLCELRTIETSRSRDVSRLQREADPAALIRKFLRTSGWVELGACR